MRTGQLNKRVTVVKYETVADGAGGTIPEAVETIETWAKIDPMRGQRALTYGQVIQSTWYDVILRYNEDITKDLTLDYNGKEIVLHSVINRDERGRILEAVGYEKL
jgi:SPP1 family predicted phage head-tail adaptor